MSKTIFLLFFIVIIITNQNNLNAQNSVEAAEYMSKIFTPLQETKNETWQYIKAITRSKGARRVEKKRQNLLLEIKNVRKEVSTMGAYNSDDTLKNSVVEYLNMSYTVLNEDYGKILDMEDIAEQSYDLMEAYLLAKEMASEKLDEAFDIVKIAQNNFAEKNDVNLIEGEDDKTELKIKKANEALVYYNDVYLIFFKSYKQEMYVLEALEMNDINSLVQNTNSMLTFTNEGIIKLKEMKSFQGDIRLKRAANKMLLFYKKEAETDFPAMEDFYLKKDNFEKVEKMFNSKSKRNRTQEDVDKFNEAVNAYNKAAVSVNKISDTSNKNRATNLKLWNDAVNKFFDDHS